MFEEVELHGDAKIAEKVDFSWDSWSDLSFQKAFQYRHYGHLGFRPDLIRFRNQLDVSLFKSPTNSVILGNNNQLYSRGNFESAIGRDFVGDSALLAEVNRIKTLQDFLRQKGIIVLTVLTPNKMRAQFDDLPADHLETLKNFDSIANPTNYARFLHHAQQRQIDLIDLNPIFRHWLPKAEYPFFPNTGYHWTDFGATVGMDYLFTEMSRRSGKSYPRIQVDKYVNAPDGKTTDQDLAELLNVRFPPKVEGIYLPELADVQIPEAQKPRVLTISDSFWWKVYDQKIPHRYFKAGSPFWYYCDQVYVPGIEAPGSINNVDPVKAIEPVDFVLLMTNEGNLGEFDWACVEGILRRYAGK